MASTGHPASEALADQGLFEQAMRHAAIGMALVSAQGRFLEVNPALCRMLGRDEAALRQLLLRDITHPDDLATSLELVEELVSGQPEAFERETRYLHADGRVIWGQVSVSCLRRDTDCLLIVQIIDISQSRRQRQALAASALAITEAIPVGTYTMRLPPGGGMASFAFMSERFLQICGLKREEAAADPFRAFACVHPDDHEAWVRLNAEAFAHKRPFAGECRIMVDGEVRWISAESVPRELADGSTVWEGVLVDITRQHQTLETLQQERALLETVLSHIDAHVFMKDRQGRYL